MSKTALAGRGVISIRLPGRPHPDEQTAAKVMAAGSKAGSYIAVGSGTINDLAKFSAAQQGKRCAVFATAPSMNGYTSVNVAITMRRPQEIAARRRARRRVLRSLGSCRRRRCD